MAQVEVITGADRRRCFTMEQKRRFLAEAFAPGVNVKAFCRRHDIAYSVEFALYVAQRTGSIVPARSQ
jgi:transposase-like protein